MKEGILLQFYEVKERDDRALEYQNRRKEPSSELQETEIAYHGRPRALRSVMMGTKQQIEARYDMINQSGVFLDLTKIFSQQMYLIKINDPYPYERLTTYKVQVNTSSYGSALLYPYFFRLKE